MNRAFPLKMLILLAVICAVGVGFVFVLLRSGPLAPIPVTVVTVENQPLAPALFGIGTVEARYTHKIGPTFASRVREVSVHVGDLVRAGQVIGEMDPVDLDDRLAAQDAAVLRAASSVRSAEAQIREAEARAVYARAQARRFEELARTGAVSQDSLDARRQELQVAESGLSAVRSAANTARHDVERLRSEGRGLSQQRDTVRLYAPVDGLVIRREAEQGATVVAGQSVVEIIDPAQLWVHTRFDQLRAQGLRAGLPARVVLRSRSGERLVGSVARVEPVADAVTEELLAKVVFDVRPEPLPALGELAEVTVGLPSLPSAPTIPMACVRRVGEQLGVWVVEEGGLRFVPVVLGVSDLDGAVQVREGLAVGQVVVEFSRSALSARSRIAITDRLPGALK